MSAVKSARKSFRGGVLLSHPFANTRKDGAPVFCGSGAKSRSFDYAPCGASLRMTTVGGSRDDYFCS